MYTVLVRDPRDRERLCAFFREVHVRVVEAVGDRIDVDLTGAVSALHAQRELSGYVVTWNALNPGAHAEIVH
ncbi:MAG TPA: hypothetical protein VHC01_02775 [Gaiellaceae bacterium]|jgi:hypothetical protein|nr:hypothetical protein [Gaiellaceae bacterium]